MSEKPVEVIDVYATRRVGFTTKIEADGRVTAIPQYAPLSLSDPIFKIMQITAVDGKCIVRAKGRRNIDQLMRVLELLNPQMKQKFDTLVLKNVGSDERLVYECALAIEQDISIPEKVQRMKEEGK